MVSPAFLRHLVTGAAGTISLFLVCAGAHGQESSPPVNVRASDSDRYAASQVENAKHHARPANTPVGKQARPGEISNMHAAARPEDAGGSGGVNRYPADLQYHGGPVITSMQQHLIYVNLDTSASCSTVATCWGDPRGFLRDLGRSRMIHIVDQYTGNDADNQYTVSNTPILVDYVLGTPAPAFTDADMQTIVHAVAAILQLGTGYTNEYHVFLVPGQDECFDSTFSVCYSPDNPNTFFFCAYHGSVDFKDIGHVIYSVEPFQNVGGCSVRPGTPNGSLVDSTNNVLSHETFESITDPDGTAWWNSQDNALFGAEIGDECSFVVFTVNGGFFDPSNVVLKGKNYAIQPEASNARHACTTAPGGDE